MLKKPKQTNKKNPPPNQQKQPTKPPKFYYSKICLMLNLMPDFEGDMEE